MPMAAVAETGSGLVLHPFILRSIDGDGLGSSGLGKAFDITSPYGYSGAFCWNVESFDANLFWDRFDEYCRDVGVVSEFTRLALFEDSRLSPAGQPKFVSLNVVRDLRMTPDEMWREFEHKVRKNVNKARRNDVQVDVDLTGTRMGEFVKIYESTMARRNASAEFNFPASFFESIACELGGQFALFIASHNDRAISVELVLVSADTVYSFLGGTNEETFDVRPNDLLKFEVIQWAKARSKKRYVLGGGYAPDDGIFRYKKAFAPNGLTPYYTSSRVFDQGVYDRLVDSRRAAGQRRGHSDWQTSRNYFPEYRCPLPRVSSLVL